MWERWCQALEAPATPRVHHGLTTLFPGRAQGPLAGGNLSLLHTSALTRRWKAPERAVLFVEEVGEAPYRIDRMLISLQLSGALDHISGLVVGEISEATPGPHGIDAKQVFAEFAERLAVPALWGQPSGHGARNDPLHLGQVARIEDGCLTTCFAVG
jgi:muramoyltetrapeptide carboxypeptidase